MNEIAMKGILKVVKNLLPPDAIRSAADSLVKTAIDFKNQIQIDKEAGEMEVIGMVYEVENHVYIALGVINAEHKILRIENVKPLNEVIETFIQKM